MPISLGNSGSGRPFIRFSPQANAWLKSGDGGATEFDPRGSGMLIDVEQAVFGWLTLGEGVREWEPWPSINARTKSPGGEAKVGFMVQVYAPKLLGEEVHDFSANATASTRFFEALYNQCEKEFGKGKVPLVQITGSKILKIGKGTTREVEFNIAKWVDRPQALADIATEEPPETKPASRFDADYDAKSEPKAEAKKELADADLEF